MKKNETLKIATSLIKPPIPQGDADDVKANVIAVLADLRLFCQHHQIDFDNCIRLGAENWRGIACELAAAQQDIVAMPAKTERIAALNDLCRVAMGIGGLVVQTEGICAMSPDDQSAIREKIECFNDFSPDNNPHGERDFGAFDHAGEHIYWKIDYYDRTLSYGSADPSDPAKTVRVLTIMLACEY